jgi:hypothetical protein
MMRWAEHVVRRRGMRNVYNIFIGKPDTKRLFGRPRSRQEDNIRMTLGK